MPSVSVIALGDDPTYFAGKLQDSRYFEPRTLTSEDGQRTNQYKAERARAQLASTGDMSTYLKSLEMKALLSEFVAADVPRISQLINKSNQFNLTTRRKTEAEVDALRQNPNFSAFTARLADRFGDNGLISVVILQHNERALEIETWLMSCRVLKRQMEHEVLDEIVRIARERGHSQVIGTFIPTPKNELVKSHYVDLGFTPFEVSANMTRYSLATATYRNFETAIDVTRRSE